MKNAGTMTQKENKMEIIGWIKHEKKENDECFNL